MAADTPKYWKQYETYVSLYNSKRTAEYLANEQALQDEYDALPWYKKLLTADPSMDWARYIPLMPNDKEPSILDYYHWDTHIRGK